MLNICSNLFGEWNDKNIEYCHWKSNEHLMEGLDGLTDLDIFVSPKDKSKAEYSLSKNKYIKCIPQKGARYPMVDEWIGFDHATGKLVHIHLHYQIITGTKFNKEYVFPIDELIIDSRLKDKETDLYIVSPDLEIIILYARVVLKAKNKKSITAGKDYIKEIDYLKARIDLQKLRDYCCSLMCDMGEEVYNLIIKDTLTSDDWYKLYRIFEKWLATKKKYSKLAVWFRYKYYYFRSIRNEICNKRMHRNFITRKTFPDNGKIFCFLGADGSGKSTVSIDIQKWLSWKVEVKRFYLGSGDHYNSLTKRLLKLSSSKAASNKNKASVSAESTFAKKGDEIKVEEQKKTEKVSFKRRLLRFGYDMLQSTYLKQVAVKSYKEAKKAYKYSAKGAVALFDRFPQNQFVNLYDGPKIAVRYLSDYKNPYIRFMAHCEENAIKKAQKFSPEIVFIKLHLPPEESVRRKPDHTLEEVAPKAQITAKLKFEGSAVYDIDATQEYCNEVLEIKRIIWKELTEK